MQKWATDYYELTQDAGQFEGCCLICEDAKDGCLCKDCKCSKCYHYAPENCENKCEKALDFRERNDVLNSYDEYYSIDQVIKETDKAILCTITNLTGQHWIPIKMIKGSMIKIWILVEKKLLNLIEYMS